MTLRCDVTGDVTDDIQVTWLKDGVSLVDNDRVYGNESSGELTVTDMSENDSGEYACAATREEQVAQDAISIQVQGENISIFRLFPTTLTRSVGNYPVCGLYIIAYTRTYTQ